MENRLVDALATITSRVHMAENPFNIQIVQKEQPIYRGCESVLLELPDCANWWYAINVPLKDISGYIIISHELYYHLPSRILAKCVNNKEAYHRLREIHDHTSGHDSRVSLYRRVQRAGYYWPNMAQQSTEFQHQCVSCQ
ncbi:hypothetical protein SLE2022_141740 [Rubroshorea leprosula]